MREPEAVFWVFVFPLLLAARARLRLPREAAGPHPDRIVARGPGMPRRSMKRRCRTLAGAAAASLLRRQEGREALRIGQDLAARRAGGAGRPVDLPFRRDPARLAHRAPRGRRRAAARRRPQRSCSPCATELVTEKGSRYIDFLIPGLLGMNLMGTGIWSLAFSITGARSRRMLKRLMATPDAARATTCWRRCWAGWSSCSPRSALLAGFGWLVFDVPMRGSLLLFSLVCVLGAMSFCGLGLLTASRVRHHRRARAASPTW